MHSNVAFLRKRTGCCCTVELLRMRIRCSILESIGIDISVAGILIYLYSLLNLNNRKRIVCFVMVEFYDIIIGRTYQKTTLALAIRTRKD